MKKIYLLFVLLVCFLSGCNVFGRKSVPLEKDSVKDTLKAESSHEPVFGRNVQKKAGTGNPDVEKISVGESTIALRQGKSKKYVEVIRTRSGVEELLATFKWKVESCHIEAFKNVLCHDGFLFFVRQQYNPYGAEVYYIGLEEEKARVLFANHAIYDEDTKTYHASFDTVLDVDSDGEQEVISNVYYFVDGGAEACLYDYVDGKVMEGACLDLFDLKKGQYMNGRVTDLKSMYNEKTGKVEIHYISSKKRKSAIKKYKLDPDKITMKKRELFWVSDEMKDIENYD